LSFGRGFRYRKDQTDKGFLVLFFIVPKARLLFIVPKARLFFIVPKARLFFIVPKARLRHDKELLS
jgi:hypothetical protein